MVQHCNGTEKSSWEGENIKKYQLKSIVYQYFYIITIDGQEVYNVENSEPRVFQDVKVFAGDEQGAADARYKNLVWETDVCKT